MERENLDIQEQAERLYGDFPVFQGRENSSHITEDGLEIWESRSVAVVLTIVFWDKQNNDFYIPMGKRGIACPDEIGKFSLPCGYMDWDESATDSAFRETWEEIGLFMEKFLFINTLKGKVAHQFTDQPWHVGHHPNANRQNVTLNFGVVVEWDDMDNLPELTNAYNEKVGEVDEIKYFNFHEYLKGSSDDDIAFGHQHVVEGFLKRLDYV
jgi:ADP-ribose pyrophosphatase YjhB (NUDIX family)